MPFATVVRVLPGAILVAVLFISPAAAQTSSGFSDPEDITNLLEYRLPDWGYRIWDLGFNPGGSGGDRYAGELQQSATNSFRTGLDTAFSNYRESEQRTYRLFAEGTGAYRQSHAASGTRNPPDTI